MFKREEVEPANKLSCFEMEDGTNGDWELREDKAMYLNKIPF